MSNREHDRHDNADWSNASSSLFRGARRAHDPTPDERAAIDAVLARIQAGNSVAPGAVSAAGGGASSGAAPAVLAQIAKVSLAIVFVAVAAIGVMRLARPPSEPARGAGPAASATAGSAAPVAVLPAATPSAERSADPPIAVARAERIGAPRVAPVPRGEGESRPRSQRPAVRANAGRQRSPQRDEPSISEAPTSAPSDGFSNIASSAPSNDDAQHDRADSPSSAANAAAALRQAAPRAREPESDLQEAPTPTPTPAPAPRARKPAPSPADVRTELALLKRMHAALREADFSTVLDLCAEHEQRWPHGLFELEREGVHAIASCGANKGDAVPRAKKFLTAHPHAPVAMRVSSACSAQLPKR